MSSQQHKKKRPESRRAELPCVLTIAGSDSGGGAGIQADLKTFAALGTHGTSAITAITAQNPTGVRSIQGIRPQVVRDQIEMIFEELPPRAVKIGMLFSSEIVSAVTECLRNQRAPMVLDPVMIATSGALLLKKSAIRAMLDQLFPRAALVTPNVPETEFILGRTIREPEELREAAREIHQRWGCAALVKGGHLKGIETAADFYFDGQEELLLQSSFTRGISTHGTGCTYSAAIAAHLALGRKLDRAVELGKEFISGAIAKSYRVESHDALNPFWNR